MVQFLDMCREVARESGTFPNDDDPVTVVNQTGRLLRLVNWVKSAYRDIENERDHWKWLYDTFRGAMIPNTRTIDAGNIGIQDRFSRWEGYETYVTGDKWRLHNPATPTEQPKRLVFLEYDRFFQLYLTRNDEFGEPRVFTINPANEIVFHPIPDAAYEISGEYYKNNQPLTGDTDMIEMPDQFSEALKWAALIKMGVFDEATTQVPAWDVFKRRQMSNLRQHQLPRLEMP